MVLLFKALGQGVQGTCWLQVLLQQRDPESSHQCSSTPGRSRTPRTPPRRPSDLLWCYAYGNHRREEKRHQEGSGAPAVCNRSSCSLHGSFPEGNCQLGTCFFLPGCFSPFVPFPSWFLRWTWLSIKEVPWGRFWTHWWADTSSFLGLSSAPFLFSSGLLFCLF